MRFWLVAIALSCTGVIASSSKAQSAASPFTSGARYDVLGRVVGTIAPDPDGGGPLGYAAMRTTYDARGWPVRVDTGELLSWQPDSVAPTNWTDFTIHRQLHTDYDLGGRKVKETVTAGPGAGGGALTVTQYSYDGVGRLECTAVRMNPSVYGSLPSSACTHSTAGPAGPDRITKNIYDAAGQLLQVRRAVGTPLEQAYATYTYTPNGQQQDVIDANGNRAELSYDGHDRLERWSFPSKTGPASYNDATVASALSSAGAVSTTDYEQYGYDANGNRTSLRKRSGETVSYVYDALNRVTRIDYPSPGPQDIYYDYDLRGLELYARHGSTGGPGVTTTYDGFGRIKTSATNTNGATRTLSYQYDANGNRTRVTHPDGMFFVYDYDGLDRVTAIRENGASSGLGVLATYTYNAEGRRERLMRGSASRTDYDYDAAGRLESLEHAMSGTDYDNTDTFTYLPSSQIGTQSRTNDARYAWATPENASAVYTANGLNQYSAVSGQTFLYDARGNLTSDGTWSFTYDLENRLTLAAEGMTSVALSYDPKGRLSYTDPVSSPDTRLVYDGDALVLEYDAAGTLLRRYVHGPGVDDPILWYEGSGTGSRRFLHADARGSIIARSNTGGTGVESYTYGPWGEPDGLTGSRFRYTGQMLIPEIGFYHYKARIYSPWLGRFLQTDPIGYEDQINLYAYVGNDPVNLVDPTGMSCGSLIDGVENPYCSSVSMSDPQEQEKEKSRDERSSDAAYAWQNLGSFGDVTSSVDAAVQLEFELTDDDLADFRLSLGQNQAEASSWFAGIGAVTATLKALPRVAITKHGMERIAWLGATRGGTLSPLGIATTRMFSTARYSQANGGVAYVRALGSGRYNVAIFTSKNRIGFRKYITSFDHINQRRLQKLAIRYGWN